MSAPSFGHEVHFCSGLLPLPPHPLLMPPLEEGQRVDLELKPFLRRFRRFLGSIRWIHRRVRHRGSSEPDPIQIHLGTSAPEQVKTLVRAFLSSW